LFKVEASVYPIDDNFNMCGKEGFYEQSMDESIDCAFTEAIGYGFMAVGAGFIVLIYGATFVKIFFKKMTDPLAFMPEIEVDVNVESDEDKRKRKIQKMIPRVRPKIRKKMQMMVLEARFKKH